MASEPLNEPILSYGPGSPERSELRAEIARQSDNPAFIPLRLGGASGAATLPMRAPHRHDLHLGDYEVATAQDVRRAISRALAARSDWAARDLESRTAIFRRAAELLEGRFRQRLNAATVLGQSKT
ncbi:MAG TPA: aldehyde dehydrogenase family protein, partial [Polyangiaceae bacterium]|nr:aldehyde dehydrogenase family protein [Polyangiaceae bacterium]